MLEIHGKLHGTLRNTQLMDHTKFKAFTKTLHTGMLAHTSRVGPIGVKPLNTVILRILDGTMRHMLIRLEKVHSNTAMLKDALTFSLSLSNDDVRILIYISKVPER